jgi:hypothetical protein
MASGHRGQRHGRVDLFKDRGKKTCFSQAIETSKQLNISWRNLLGVLDCFFWLEFYSTSQKLIVGLA